MTHSRVVVTGIGVISSIGIGKEEFWNNILMGNSGISLITAFNTEGLPNRYGGEIRLFNPQDFMDKDYVKIYGRASQFAVAAAKLAISDAGLNLKDVANTNIDVIVGTTMGETQAIESIDSAWVENGEESVSNQWISQYPGNNLAMSIAYDLNSTGLSITIPTACSAGNYAVGYGYDLICAGKSSKAIVGGSDAFSKIAYVGFNRLYAMASEKCRPFDKNRDGMLLGEGAGFLILETLESAMNRKARIYAEILGYALSSDASSMTIPNEEGVVDVIQKSLNVTGKKPSDIDYISAHGTGTPMNDKTECVAINRVFGGLAKQVSVSSIKSMLGHTMGAASAIEAVSCCLAIYDSKIPPTINYENPDEECKIDCVPNFYRKKEVKVALNNSFAFGGNNACLVLGKVK